jgi:hypothetical protein
MVTQTQYNAFREDVLRNQPLRKTVALTDLKFITMDCVEYAGLKLGVNRQAIKDLLKIVGISVSGMNNLEDSIGEDNAQRFLNAIKNAIGSSKGLQVTIAVTTDRVISRIQKQGSTDLISAETYFDTFERLANDHNLDIQSMDFNKGNGNIYLSTIAPKSGQYQVGQLSDEVFTTGISISRTMEGIQADPYMHRLVCTNGMIARMFEESFRLRSMDPKMWQEFYQHMEKIEKAGFAPTKFSEAVLRASQTPASLKELERGMNLITANSNCPTEELEFFFKGHKNTYNRIHAAGIDTVKLTDAQKANVRTGLSVWDVINGVTDFASHNYGYEKKSNSDRHLQMAAGDILSKQFDTANLVLNQPF